MYLENPHINTLNHKHNRDSSVEKLLLILKYPELINNKSSSPEINLKKENMAMEKDITKRIEENDKFLFRRHIELLSQEKTTNYNLRYRPSVTGNKLGKLIFKTSKGSIKMWFQTFFRNGESGIECNFDFIPTNITIDKKIKLLKQLHNLINTKLGL